MKATAKAPANIAFIKFWGKKDAVLRLPLNGSISMNLSNIYTLTTVEFDKDLVEDKIEIVGGNKDEEGLRRIEEHLDRIRKLARLSFKARVVSKNNFPKGTGIASSASGFAALSLAGTKALGMNLSQKDLSILARLGSGSACRSIPDGFVEWVRGDSNETSYAHSLYPTGYWRIADVVAIVTKTEKKVTSTKGHTRAESSPFLEKRISAMGNKIRMIKDALAKRDITMLGEIIEREAFNMHAVMMTSSPPILYWLPTTVEIMLRVQQWRREGLESYFTIDAGPTVHLICLEKNKEEVARNLKKIVGVKEVVVNVPADGAKLAGNDLF